MGTSLTEFVDSVDIGGLDNIPCPAGYTPAYFVSFAPENNFKLETFISIPALFINTNIQLLAHPKNTILSGTIGLIQQEKNWYNNVINTDFQVRNEFMLHSYGQVAYVGDECSYSNFANYVGLRPSFSVPSFTRLFTCLIGKTITELALIYPSTIIEIITKYGEKLGFIQDGVVISQGKMFLHTTAYNSGDLEAVSPIT